MSAARASTRPHAPTTRDIVQEPNLGADVVIPATALCQVLRVPARQVHLMRLLRQPTTRTVALDRTDASLVGQLLGVTRTTDIADAHVVICARRARHAVITSDAGDLRHLDPTVRLIEV